MDFIKNNVNKKTIKSILILFLLIFSGYILADLVCTVIMEKTVIKPAVVKVTPQSAESKPFIKPLSKYTELLKPVFKEYTDNTDKEPADRKSVV